MTLDVDDLRGFVESSLSDDALGLLLDAAYEAIDAVLGSAGYDGPVSITELLSPRGDLLMLSRQASAITAVAERDIALAQDDYALIGDQVVRRLRTGTSPRSCWMGRVEITYEGLPLDNERDRAAIALVKLDTTYAPGVSSERLGDHSITFGSATSGSTYTAEREAILSSLISGFVAR